MLRMIDHIENALACQSDGMQPPMVDPTITPSQIAFLLIAA